jgi:hypothetical protein
MKKINEEDMNELMRDAGCALCDPAVCVQCDKRFMPAVAIDDNLAQFERIDKSQGETKQ